MIYSGQAVDVFNGDDGPEVQISSMSGEGWVGGPVYTVAGARTVYRELGEALAAIAPTTPAWVLDSSYHPDVWVLAAGRNADGEPLYRVPAADSTPITLATLRDTWGIAEQGPEVRVP